uniref:DNA-directed RNA polymerase n=1 Tax=Flabellia petiolata TaxID=189428 RepID=A0A386AX75_9CHLO|nr:RNA polymerase b-subunit [Flabellia petiolata]
MFKIKKISSALKRPFILKNILLEEKKQKIVFFKKIFFNSFFSKNILLYLWKNRKYSNTYLWAKREKISALKNVTLQNFEKSNQNTYLFQRPIYHNFQWIQKGDLLGDCSGSNKGDLALGKNLLVGYMPWEGFNFEDAVLINEKVVSKYISLHIEKYDLEICETLYGLEKITRNIPGLLKTDIQKLDKNGVIKIGSWVKEGDILVGKIIPTATSKQTFLTHEKLLYDIVGEKTKTPNIQEKCLRVPQGGLGRIIRISYISKIKNQINTKKSENESKMKPLKAVLKKKKKTKYFLKLIYISDRYCSIFIKFRLDKKTLTSHNILNMAGVPKLAPFGPVGKRWANSKRRRPFNFSIRKFRWNIFKKDYLQLISFRSRFRSPSASGPWGALKRALKRPPDNFRKTSIINSLKKITLYIAEKREFQIGDKISGRHGNKGIISQILSNYDMPYLSNGRTLDVLLNPLGVPSRMNVGQILECLLGFAGHIFNTKFQVLCFDEIYGYEASRSFIYSKLFELCKKTHQKWIFSKKTPGKLNLFDGRNGKLFKQSVLVGSTYLMKLIHIVDEKIHARATGPYSLITQQPLRGRAKHGGQRLGEMEVWALQGFGSAYTLQEFLTVKSDDLQGRNKIMQTLLKNTPLHFGTPESLRVVLRELQCLCLDLQLSD